MRSAAYSDEGEVLLARAVTAPPHVVHGPAGARLERIEVRSLRRHAGIDESRRLGRMVYEELLSKQNGKVKETLRDIS